MIGPEVTVPDLTEAVIGYRRFAVSLASQHNYQLVSPYARTPWTTAEVTAKCMATVKVPEGIVLPTDPRPHPAPAKDCGCGIYVYFDPCPIERRSYDYSYGDHEVQALMSVSGRIEVHASGMRAEKARLCALSVNDELSADEKIGLTLIAKSLGVPLVTQDSLPTMAPEFGRELGPEMRPVSPSPLADEITDESGSVGVPRRRSRLARLSAAFDVYFNAGMAGANLAVCIALSSPWNGVGAVVCASLASWSAGKRSAQR